MANYGKIEPGGNDTGAALNVSRRIGLVNKYINLDGKYILDCGCGSGDYVVEFLKYSSNVFGIEYNGDKVRAFKSLNIYPDKVTFGNVEHLNFENDKFDMVFVNEVLEHVSNERMALEEIRRVLKPYGIMMLFSPNRFYPFETHGIKIRKNNFVLPHLVPFIPYIPLTLGNRIFVYGARNYFPWELRIKIEDSGFKIMAHTFIWQTFENLSRKSPWMLIMLGPLLRKISFVLEKIPGLNIFGVSQVIIAKKDDKFKR